MNKFRSFKSRVLIASDVWAGGIDSCRFLMWSIMIYRKPELYIHRIGRAGRFGWEGVAISRLTFCDMKTLWDMELYHGTRIREMPADLA
ncbi:LOW QUALITY PROTEIN: hypothetical protein HID58_018588 [Brassica napus]|uniref:Helicase C-terminal domain-containing protein n=1 Tax=Brassica napus TaxID=3708 RepID=A0ABQ8DBI2_BRANA|nr:LOW QUALITY PROTEIN: hypothetical protein HID58_018588 [Brassica napus]